MRKQSSLTLLSAITILFVLACDIPPEPAPTL